VVKGADPKAVKAFLGRFPLDESASPSELVAALTERNHRVAALESQVVALRAQVAEIPALKAQVAEIPALESENARLLAQLEEWRANPYLAPPVNEALLARGSWKPIVFVTPELGPFSKVGGLSTMVWDLAAQLAEFGFDVHCVSPYYQTAADLTKTYGVKLLVDIQVKLGALSGVAGDQVRNFTLWGGTVQRVKCWFIRNTAIFTSPAGYAYGMSGGAIEGLNMLTGGLRVLEMISSLARAAIQAIVMYGPKSGVIVTNDWNCSLVAKLASVDKVLTTFKFCHLIHNLGPGYDGRILPDATYDTRNAATAWLGNVPLADRFNAADKATMPTWIALDNSAAWATVSPAYQKELLASAADFKTRLAARPNWGILNGINVAARLSAIASLKKTRAEAKAAVQMKYLGRTDVTAMLCVFVGRLATQKGVIIICDTFAALSTACGDKFQVIVGGQATDQVGDIKTTMQKLSALNKPAPRMFWWNGDRYFEDGLLSLYGADFCLMPSIFEPCGLVQQEAFTGGTPVIAAKVGGLGETVVEGYNGFLFDGGSAAGFQEAVKRAYSVFKDSAKYTTRRANATKSALSVKVTAVSWANKLCGL
jgi:glycogen synthase